jgi:hypothetical protein
MPPLDAKVRETIHDRPRHREARTTMRLAESPVLTTIAAGRDLRRYGMPAERVLRVSHAGGGLGDRREWPTLL